MQRLSPSFVAFVLAGALFAPAAGSQTQAPFRSSVSPIGAALRAQMTSWHKGCPVPISDLRLVGSASGASTAEHTRAS